MKKKFLAWGIVSVVAVLGLAGCSAATKEFNKNTGIVLVSREDGSGTRGAFVELFGLSEKQEDGSTYDRTSLEAIISNSTSVVMLTVNGNPYAMGYISLGSINNTIKPLKIDGVEPSIENVKNDSYKITRSFLLVTKPEVSDSAKDFIEYINSEEGQAIVEKSGYISVGNTGPYSGTGATEKVVIAGSSSVSPMMEKIKEGYLQTNPKANIEIQQSDSTVGITSTAEGIVDIGMASRELKQSEIDKNLVSQSIAKDALAVIVNLENPLEDLTTQQVGEVFGGKITQWSQLIS